MSGGFDKENLKTALEQALQEAASLEGRLIVLRNKARTGGRSMQDRGTNRSRRDAAGSGWAEARREAERVDSELQNVRKRIEELKSEYEAAPDVAEARGDENSQEDAARPPSPDKRQSERVPATETEAGRKELAERIERAYTRLTATRRKLLEASEELVACERGLKVENAEMLLEAKNERTANLYLEGILDASSEYWEFYKGENWAELEHYEAQMEAERLNLLVRLVEKVRD